MGKQVTVDASGLIGTAGDFSAGVFAQSVGGGGGTGGNATNLSLSLTPPPTAPEDFIPTPSANVDVSMGGDGGSGAHAGIVTVDNAGTVVTSGNFAPGVMAQSVGGSGGFGGDARSIQVELTADPMDFVPLTQLTSLDLTMVFGGDGGTGSYGEEVTVSNQGSVVTTGAFSHGIVAQSVGGGGGSGGSAMSFEFSNADVVPEIPVLDDISGLTTLEMTLQGSGGGGGGDGRKVTLDSAGDIMTSGVFAMGVVAQSVAGGGGLAGLFNPQGVISNEIGDALFNAVMASDAGLSFAGSVGGAGNAGEVIVRHVGNIRTSGDAAHGLFAQSAAGQGTAGRVDVVLDGAIEVSGRGADGVHAHSGGAAGSGPISVRVEDGGSIRGGSGTGAALRLSGGTDNVITNHGALSAQSGTAIAGDSGGETVFNHGTVTGSVALGAGANAFHNEGGGLFNSGEAVGLGAGNLLNNQGVLAPGGDGALMRTALGGDLVQGVGGVMAFDLDLGARQSDRLDVSGSARLDGRLRLAPANGGYASPGSQRYPLIMASGGIAAEALALEAERSAVVSYALASPSSDELVVDARVDFSPAMMRGNARRIGEHVNAVQAAGGSADFAPFAAGLIAQPDLASLESAYEMLSPALIGSATTLATLASAEFNDAMHSCREREGRDRFLREGECGWFRVGRANREQRRTEDNDGYELATVSVAGGVQRALAPGLSLGVGLAYQRSDLEARNAGIDGDRVEAGVILKRQFDATAISGSFNVGYGRYDSARRIDFAGPVQVAKSSHDLWSASVQARVSRDLLQGDDVYVRPMLSAAVTHVARNGFREKGAGGASLDVEHERDTAVTVQPAIEVGGERKLDDGSLLRPRLRLGVTQYLTGGERETTATLLGAPDGVGPFTVTNRTDKTYVDVVAGVDLLSSGGSTLRLDYTGQFSRNSSSNAVWVKYSIPF